MTTNTIDIHKTSVTLEPVRSNFYLRLWRGVPRELGFLLLTFPIATVGFVFSMSLLGAGIGTLITVFIGVFLLAVLFYLARGFGTLELVRLGWAGRPPITRPEWPRTPGFWGLLRSIFGNGHYWLYALHTAIVNYVISFITWMITVLWLSIGLGAASFWIWARFTPHVDHWWFFSRWLTTGFRHGSFAAQPTNGDWVLEILVYLGLGLVLVLTLPFVTRGLVQLHYLIAKGMLSAFASDALRVEVSNLSTSRGAAVSAEGHSLRRLERDIHDGPQQRLVRLQMDLAAAERKLATDPDSARTLIAGSKVLAQDALEELRALSRGFAPPILLDRGLFAALESLASRSTLPVTVESSLGAEVKLPQEIERNAYFLASELLANAAKHSRAKAAKIVLTFRHAPENDDSWLDVTVTDDGHGGATSPKGHGLAGLEERVRGLGGTLEVVSPEGGPTAITGHLPVRN